MPKKYFLYYTVSTPGKSYQNSSPSVFLSCVSWTSLGFVLILSVWWSLFLFVWIYVLVKNIFTLLIFIVNSSNLYHQFMKGNIKFDVKRNFMRGTGKRSKRDTVSIIAGKMGNIFPGVTSDIFWFLFPKMSCFQFWLEFYVWPCIISYVCIQNLTIITPVAL